MWQPFAEDFADSTLEMFFGEPNPLGSLSRKGFSFGCFFLGGCGGRLRGVADVGELKMMHQIIKRRKSWDADLE